MATWLEKSRSPEYSPAKLSQMLATVESIIGIDELDEAMAHETIIVGGYLNTHLIKAESIVAEHIAAKSIKAEKLDVEDLAAISGKFTGNVYVGGDLLVGGQGVLSVLTHQSSGELDGYQMVGIWDLWDWIASYQASVSFYVPPNFTVIDAVMYIKSIPRRFEGHIGVPDGFYHARNLKLYTVDSTDGFIDFPADSEFFVWFGNSGRTDITQSVLGASTFSPTGNSIHITSGSIAGHITSGQRHTFVVQSTDEASMANARYGSGMQFEIYILGYKS